MSMYSLGNDLYSGKKSFNIIGKRKIWYTISLVFVALTAILLMVKPINLGIDFRGGSQFTISGTTNSSQQDAIDIVAEYSGEDNARVSEIGANSIRVQTGELSNEETQEVRSGLAEAYGVPIDDVASTFIGPTWGADVSKQALQSLVVFIILISIVLWIYFRTWTIAVGAIGALLHDLIITVGVYVASGFEVTPATVIGLLTILGYSLYDTVVVFDKVRENTSGFADQEDYTYAEAANLAVNQTLIRSINTSVTGLLPVGAILVIGVLFQGAGTLRDLSLALFVGMLISAISSIFVASPLAVTLGERQQDIKEHTERVLARREAGAELSEEKKA
ncbi:protein translocase subunit SecF [Flaviflexus massiliensis]|uniref:protein translocase subunit SecF n=1 Tax=Flaviflexus massiliensis TaxID=1522309 RepID=UPI0006D54DE3|nr:protein translocase subunit SecF [Flaviflexus massiliensis]